MDTFLGQVPGGPARHGDTLSPNGPPPNLEEILGTEVCEKVAAACNFMALQMQSRREPAVEQIFPRTALLFKVVRQ